MIFLHPNTNTSNIDTFRMIQFLYDFCMMTALDALFLDEGSQQQQMNIVVKLEQSL